MRRNWFVFFSLYGAVAAIGCAGIFVWISGIDDPGISRLSNTIGRLIPWQTQTSMPQPVPHRQDDEQQPQHAVHQDAQRADAQASYAQQPRNAHTPRKETTASAPVHRQKTPPAVNWGVATNSETRVYAPTGEFQGRMPAGTLVEVVETRLSKTHGELVVFKMWRGEQLAGPFLARLSDIDIAHGPLSDAPERERTLRIERARLLKERFDTIDRTQKEREQANPHRATYRDARNAYATHVNNAEAIQAKLDSASPGKRTEYLNQLRQMHVDGIRLQRQYEAARKSYTEWHEKDAGSSLPNQDVFHIGKQIAQISSELKEYKRNHP